MSSAALVVIVCGVLAIVVIVALTITAERERVERERATAGLRARVRLVEAQRDRLSRRVERTGRIRLVVEIGGDLVAYLDPDDLALAVMIARDKGKDRSVVVATRTVVVAIEQADPGPDAHAWPTAAAVWRSSCSCPDGGGAPDPACPMHGRGRGVA